MLQDVYLNRVMTTPMWYHCLLYTSFQIEQVQPYAKGYNDCIAEAQEDQKRDARPELKAYPESIDDYDVIYLGYPNYWSTMPMAVFTFLEHFDFSGKVISCLLYTSRCV